MRLFVSSVTQQMTVHFDFMRRLDPVTLVLPSLYLDMFYDALVGLRTPAQ